MRAIIEAIQACVRDTGCEPSRVVVARDVWDRALAEVVGPGHRASNPPPPMEVWGVPVWVDDLLAPGTVCAFKAPLPASVVDVSYEVVGDSLPLRLSKPVRCF